MGKMKFIKGDDRVWVRRVGSQPNAVNEDDEDDDTSAPYQSLPTDIPHTEVPPDVDPGACFSSLNDHIDEVHTCLTEKFDKLDESFHQFKDQVIGELR